MATTLPNMGLVQWNLSTDAFNHVELSSNLQAIDDHDHTLGRGVQIPTAGLANGAVSTAKLAPGAVDATKVGDGTLSDAKLASPNNGLYRTIAIGSIPITAGFVGTKFAPNGVLGGVDAASTLLAIPLVAADYTVLNKTVRLQIRLALQVNTVTPNSNYSAGLYPIASIAGAANAIRYNMGAVAGSQASVNTPAASSNTIAASADFGWPGDGAYALGLTSTATPAATSFVTGTVVLRVRNT